MVNLNKVRGLRAEHRMTQEEIAKSLQISRTSYIKKENGEVQFTFEEAIKISKILNVKLEDLVEKVN